MRAMTLAALLLAAPAFGQTVYKCKGEDGVPVFSQRPCGADAQEVDTSAALKTGSGGNVQGVSDMAAMGKIDHECRMEALAIGDRYAARRWSVQREIASTQQLIGRTNNNLAGANLQAGLESKVAQLHGTIQMINAEEAAEHDRLTQRCNERRQAERDRQRERDNNP